MSQKAYKIRPSGHEGNPFLFLLRIIKNWPIFILYLKFIIII